MLHSGNAALFSVPWEVLIKQWAQSRGDEQAPSVEDYANEFTTWLGEQASLITPDAQKGFFRWAFRDYLFALRARIQRRLADGGLDTTVTRTPAPEVASVVDTILDNAVQRLADLNDFDGLTPKIAAEWCQPLDDDLKAEVEWMFDDVPFTDAAAKQARRIADLLVHKTEAFETDAVLTFAGYGRKDFFPSLYMVTFSGCVAGVVRRYEESRVTISADNLVTITPLGLTDAIHGFLRGLSPQYRTAAHDNLESFKTAVSALGVPKEALENAATKAHDELEDAFGTVEWDDFLKPMLDVVETLPMAELVRLADALVGLAALRQVVRGDTSVGGPVDLARLTRDGGFEWVRRKQESLVTPS